MLDLSPLEVICDEIVADLRHELEQQGHKDTGALDKSIRYEITQTGNDIEIGFYYLEYGKDLNDGVKPQNVNYKLTDLAGWAQRKGITNLPALQKLHKKVGIPTRGSYKFSKNGRRTMFKDVIVNELKKTLPSRLQDKVVSTFKEYFFQQIKNV